MRRLQIKRAYDFYLHWNYFWWVVQFKIGFCEFTILNDLLYSIKLFLFHIQVEARRVWVHIKRFSFLSGGRVFQQISIFIENINIDIVYSVKLCPSFIFWPRIWVSHTCFVDTVNIVSINCQNQFSGVIGNASRQSLCPLQTGHCSEGPVSVSPLPVPGGRRTAVRARVEGQLRSHPDGARGWPGAHRAGVETGGPAPHALRPVVLEGL